MKKIDKKKGLKNKKKKEELSSEEIFKELQELSFSSCSSCPKKCFDK